MDCFGFHRTLVGARPIKTAYGFSACSRINDGEIEPRLMMPLSTAGYFGTPVNDESLTPGPIPRRGPNRFGEWLTPAMPLA